MRLPLVLTALALAACQSPPDDADDTAGDATPIEAYDPLDWVDPFIGTGGDGAEIANINPGASVPFGMTNVGPDTRGPLGDISFYHCAGYWYGDDQIQGFSHTHPHGMGVPDYSTISMMPRDGWDDAFTTKQGRATPFSHDEEWARAGSYGVVLPEDDITVELTATMRGGHHRYTFAEGSDPVVLIDLGFVLDGSRVEEANLAYEPGVARVEGFQRYLGSYSSRFGGLRTSFVMEFDPAPVGGGAWSDPEDPQPGDTSASGTTAGVWLTFPEGTTEVVAKVAISTVDLEGARANFEAELAEGTFEEHVAMAEDAWRDRLGNVRIRGGDDRDKRVFHTALFHAALMPSRHDDVDGRYRGLDQEIHTADHDYYSDLSMWDTFRTLHPWYSLVWPDVQRDVSRSIVRMVQDGGSLPKWPLGHGYTGGMVGSPATQILADGWFKGVRDFDVDAAYDAAFASATGPRPNAGRGSIEAYLDQGYVAIENGGGSVSRTLEFAWSDHVLARWSDALGREDASRLDAQSQGIASLWYPEQGFFTGRCVSADTPLCRTDGADDAFFWPRNPQPDFVWAGHFVEGNAWHYLWFEPYDVPAMIDMQHGGDAAAFHARFEDYWTEGVYWEDDDLASDDYYWHGNEPVMHYAFLGSLSGRPDLTAGPARWILDRRYDDKPRGLDGNDDSGTLSAWYLLTSIGFFPVAGSPDYAVASPLFERVEIDRPDGTWVVRAPGTSADALYVTDMTVGGEPWTSPVIDHDTLVGGEVVVTMGEQPVGWGED